jgi:membrane-associated protease RseP (regulator of RpoE activity)
MSFVLGVVLFAVGIGICIAFHEAGHMWTARAFGMRVRRYFIGFGPTVFSFRRGDTEYGLKAIPAGGFCDIAGMTAMDAVTVEEAPRAFFRKPTWQRVVVLSAGSAMHFIIGILLLYVLAVTAGLPTSGAVVGEIACASPSQDRITGAMPPCGVGDRRPAQDAGLRPGDHITAVAGTPTPEWTDVVSAIRTRTGPTPITIDRDGATRDVTVDVLPVQRLAIGSKANDPDNRLESVGAIGIAPMLDAVYGPVAAVPATLDYTGTMFVQTGKALTQFPERIPSVIAAIGGAEPDLNRPISVVGASSLGGQAAEKGLWALFVMLLAVLNFFVGVFNLLPLLPLDGGHIAVNLYERARDMIRNRMGKAKMPPVDYTKLLPVTYVFVLVLGAVSLLTITADIVNPLSLPQ